MFETVVRSARFADLPLGWRRRAIRAAWRAQALAGRAPDLGLVPVFQQALRVSSRDARRLQGEVLFQDMLASAGWAALLGVTRRGSVHRDIDSVAIPQSDLLAQVARDRRPVILAPLHMGAFALPFVAMMQRYFAGRNMLILRAREDRPDETAAMQRIGELGINMRFLNVADKQTYLDAVRFARAGAVIVTFCDLPASYGSPSPVQLFGRPAQIAMGIGALARVTQATIVPLAVHSDLDRDQVLIGRPFESYLSGPTEKARVAELIRRHLEDSIRPDPAQWHMWPRFHEFLDLAATERGVAA